MFRRDIEHNWNWLYITGEFLMPTEFSSHLDNIRLYTVVYKGTV